jgi:peptidoglycan/LPS O-acetylase OafA/YrhL
LCVEEHFYLLWPVLLFMVRSPRARLGIALAFCMATPMARSLLRALELEPGRNLFGVTHYRIDAILWGALGALVAPGAAARGRMAIATVAAAIVVAALLRSGDLSVQTQGSALGYGAGLTCASIAAIGIVLLVRTSPHGLGTRILEARPLALLGKLSYAAYLIHFPMLDLGTKLFLSTPRMPTLGNFALLMALYVAMTAAAAALLHVCIERPFLALKDRTRPAPRAPRA